METLPKVLTNIINEYAKFAAPTLTLRMNNGTTTSYISFSHTEDFDTEFYSDTSEMIKMRIHTLDPNDEDKIVIEDTHYIRFGSMRIHISNEIEEIKDKDGAYCILIVGRVPSWEEKPEDGNEKKQCHHSDGLINFERYNGRVEHYMMLFQSLAF
jgi:hypothetical protein